MTRSSTPPDTLEGVAEALGRLKKAVVRQGQNAVNSGNLSTAGLNAALEELGLEKVPEERNYKFTLPVTAELVYQVTATSEKEARDTLRSAMTNDRRRITDSLAAGRIVSRYDLHAGILIVSAPDAPRTAVRTEPAEADPEPVTTEPAEAAEPPTLEQAQAEYTAFRDRVRNVVLDLKEKRNWCDDGTDDALRALGLERLPRVRNWRFRFEYSGGYVEYSVNSRTEERAREEALTMLRHDRDRLVRGRTPYYGQVHANPVTVPEEDVLVLANPEE